MVKKNVMIYLTISFLLSICVCSSSEESLGVAIGSKHFSDFEDNRVENAYTKFDYMWHWPAEYGDFDADYWQLAPSLQSGSDGSYTASFRDVAIGAAITIQCNGLESGESWGATWIKPDGQSIGTSTLTYLNGCFYAGFWYTCGCGWPPYMDWETFTFYITTQCSDTGLWRVDLDHNGVVYATKYINILPQVDDTKLLGLSQNDSRWACDAYDHKCHCGADQIIMPCTSPDCINSTPVTIAELGCALTSFCEILNYHGVAATPKTLNDWLKSTSNGYFADGKLNYLKIPDYAASIGKSIGYEGIVHTDSYLLNDICTYGPQAIEVQGNPNHWATAYGKDLSMSSWGIVDPIDGQKKTTDAYGNNVCRVISFCGPQFNFTDKLNAISFGFYCPVEAYLVDPKGRKMGFDPIANKNYNEIPYSSYGGPVGGGNLDDKFLDVIGAVNGDYVVTVVGTGTTQSKYAMEVYARTSSFTEVNNFMDNISTGPNVVNKFLFHYDSSNIQNSSLSGGFDGGGQRPKDVNKFLTYANPSDSQTELPSGTTTFPLMIFYGKDIITSTFKASLNSVDLTSLFHPKVGTYETVNLPISSGRNVLILSVDGNLPNRIATDTDRLVFIVK
ncbi:MAG: hypothetical protein GYA35_04395 [Thermoanaerobaculaceae bacterium]|nr:hypothetical protein [Thermoanaerobaculaceae bacterium]